EALPFATHRVGDDAAGHGGEGLELVVIGRGLTLASPHDVLRDQPVGEVEQGCAEEPDEHRCEASAAGDEDRELRQRHRPGLLDEVFGIVEPRESSSETETRVAEESRRKTGHQPLETGGLALQCAPHVYGSGIVAGVGGTVSARWVVWFRRWMGQRNLSLRAGAIVGWAPSPP